MGKSPIRCPGVFLDRDGVLNRALVRDGKPYPPRDVTELEILPGVPQALEKMRLAGFRLVVITNQPDVARGTQTREQVEAIHRKLNATLRLDAFYVCYHDDQDRCECRKPLPGMLLAAARDLELDLQSSYLVGDRWRDIEAGRRAGCKCILLDYGYVEKMTIEPDQRLGSLVEAAEWILKQSRRRERMA